MIRTIILDKENIYRGNLVLVNAQYPLMAAADSLIPIHINKINTILLQQEAASALKRVLTSIAAGNAIVPVSGYRSLEEQTDIFKSSWEEHGEAFTRKFVALPNHSEHQTGLAIDLGLYREQIDFICPDFPYEGICQTFREAAPAYGFVERYAKDKESTTGIAHEPWHFRYVGCPHAEIMVRNGFSLEEYIEYVKGFRADHSLIYQQRNEMIKIFYVPADSDKTEITLPAGAEYQISGNNINGFIITLWGV